MTKFLSVCSIVVVLLSGCGSDFPGQPSGVVKVQSTNYPNGNLGSETPYNKESRVHGVKREFYDNGQIAKEENYNDNGEQKEHDRDGALIFEGNFKNGKKDGIFRYYRNGEIVKEEEYKNDILVAKPKN
ncbi:toxin-antitoxin system YwqK family antitoxin [Campylobacter novaezeelandiae]|uniref:toxin-antitoxin system YwqK family antitoxin n=1 Tax=Campylobacter novaezeelandiae TaxID=2267891 RepID=UPI0019042B36|nr:hypothetical protein [Campylobacter novaezeelandiae]MBK1964345.1 hypothetical protein [Campylobacter novaezeelandiae]MBK1993311.1 hypothetical protein [Campylobacter novaezeelandiae]